MELKDWLNSINFNKNNLLEADTSLKYFKYLIGILEAIQEPL